MKSIVLQRWPIPASYFAERVKGMDLAASKRIHEQLRETGALDDQDYIEWTQWRVTHRPRAHKSSGMTPNNLKGWSQHEPIIRV